jgi:1-aminocyclopropane-1-carboxylate deaminase
MTQDFFFKNDVKSNNQHVFLPILEEKKIELFLKREDEIHPFVSGNKFRKLKYNLQEAQNLGKKKLLTFGGAFSNHIVATAVAGKLCGFETIGVIRGEELREKFQELLENNVTIREAHQNGMQFEFVSREEYQNKKTTVFIEKLKQKYGDFYLIPEGGTNNLAVKGCEEILTKKDEYFDYICCAVGTGGTIAGLINSAENHQKVIGFPALKGDFLTDEIKSFISSLKNNWTLENNYHFGGYAKISEELIEFINTFKLESGILLDPIYTGKMVFGILDLIKKDKFPKNSTVLVIHTGGIQGIAGINKELEKRNKTIIQIS